MTEVPIRPQEGFQEAATDCEADIAILGGSAGCGKTFTLLYEPLKYILDPTPGFNAIIFRREAIQISTTGGLWEKARELYQKLPEAYRPHFSGGRAYFQIRFPTDSVLQFNHLHHEDTVYAFQGAEICYIGFDELTHFSEDQFFYMLSRNRSTCGVEPYIRASCNPQGQGWVKDLIQWWLYPDNYFIETLRGSPIPERQGELLYVTRIGGKTILGRNPEAVLMQMPEEEAIRLPREAIRSLTFVAGKLADNQELLKHNPGYVGNLMALSDNERIKLFDGRWIDLDNDENRIYSNRAVSDIFTNTFVTQTGLPINRYITADIALEGTDKFVIAIWDGWVVKEIRTFDKTMGDEVIREIQRAALDYKVPVRHIAFDSGGVGGFLRGWFKTAFPFVGSGPPMIEQEVRKIHGEEGQKKPQYFNLRSQMFFLLRDKIENCGLFIEVVDTETKVIIEKELRAIKKMPLSSDQKLRIIPKSQIKTELKHSPDYADVLSMRCVFEVRPKKKAKRRPIA